jgi:hypothetical protein
MARRQIEDDIDLGDLLKRIRTDSKYQTFKRIVETANKRLTIDKDREEVFALHAARQSRKLFLKKMYNPSSLMDAAANDMQARSRITEIRVKASYHIEVVEKAMEAIQDHVTTQYSSDLNKYRNENQRKALIRRVGRVANNLITDGKDLLSLCDAFIGDIDKSSYHLSNLTELTKQLSNQTGRTNI